MDIRSTIRYVYIPVYIIRDLLWEKVHFRAFINFVVCVILGISVDFWAKRFSSVYISLGHYLTPRVRVTLICYS